ncbi:unnamed protein product [Rodentolepis nana]|uniref:Ovule protein n=1 Tax=Rodentolepis nana TaxID=102285 RepID=A0A0R3TNT9_RODNA|nr:unnamed protein product [Rodentolepis nana]
MHIFCVAIVPQSSILFALPISDTATTFLSVFSINQPTSILFLLLLLLLFLGNPDSTFSEEKVNLINAI